MMDRFFGVKDVWFHEPMAADGRGVHYYQYGRKDPMPANITLYNINGVALTGTAPTGFAAQKWTTSANYINAPATGNNIALTIAQPLQYFGSAGGNWANISDNNLYVWQDSKVPYANLMAKSIYDPCPPGWMTPQNTAFIDVFRAGVTALTISGSYTNGFQYVPVYTHSVEPKIYYPTIRWRQYEIGTISNDGESLIQSSTSYGTTSSYGPEWRTSGTFNGYAAIYRRSGGWGLRCISMPPQP